MPQIALWALPSPTLAPADPVSPEGILHLSEAYTHTPSRGAETFSEMLKLELTGGAGKGGVTCTAVSKGSDRYWGAWGGVTSLPVAT